MTYNVGNYKIQEKNYKHNNHDNIVNSNLNNHNCNDNHNKH